MNTTVNIEYSKLALFVNEHDYNVCDGDKKPYQFIGMMFDVDNNNTADFYVRLQYKDYEHNSYIGIKIWENNHENWSKKKVLNQILNNFAERYCLLSLYYPNINFQLIGF